MGEQEDEVYGEQAEGEGKGEVGGAEGGGGKGREEGVIWFLVFIKILRKI